MFGLLWDRMTTKKSADDQPREPNSRYSKSPQGNTSTEKVTNFQRVTSLSPSSHMNGSNFTNTNFTPQYSQYTSKPYTNYYALNGTAANKDKNLNHTGISASRDDQMPISNKNVVLSVDLHYNRNSDTHRSQPANVVPKTSAFLK
mgnify:FL=1